MKLSRLMMILLSCMTLSVAAHARGQGKDHGHGRDELAFEKQFSAENLKKLDLTAEQKEKLKELRKAHKDDAEKQREELHAAKKAFKQSLRSNATKEEVLKAFDAMLDKKELVARTRMTGLLEARDVLTPEQRANLFEDKED